MQTPLEARTAPPSDTAGTDLEFYRELTPAIPARFGLDERGTYVPKLAQPQFDQTMKLLEIRRAILDRVYNIRRNRATMQVHESVWMEYTEMLESGRGSGGALTEFQRLRLEGQRQEAKARAEYCAEKIEQWQMEIASFKALLYNTDAPQEK